ncbi:MAG: hypothetical protein FJZ38_16965, partial [Candidatus Rokubacteria bacterium]|nr:hypothetical protein [Candidatus Rokubacteria bacterium]
MRRLLSLPFGTHCYLWGYQLRRLSGLEEAAMAAKLFVGNLSFQATEEDLRELFAQA